MTLAHDLFLFIDEAKSTNGMIISVVCHDDYRRFLPRLLHFNHDIVKGCSLCSDEMITLTKKGRDEHRSFY